MSQREGSSEREGGQDPGAGAESPGTGTDATGTGTGPRRYSLRRAPRYRAFVLTGAAIGVAAAAILTVVFPDSGQFSARALFGYVAVVLALLCGLAGALAAIFVERPRR